jgi:hypothetical protein
MASTEKGTFAVPQPPPMQNVVSDEKFSTANVTADDTAIAAPESHRLTQWNSPSINRWRFFVTLLNFLVMGLNDGAFGVCNILSIACS